MLTRFLTREINLCLTSIIYFYRSYRFPRSATRHRRVYAVAKQWSFRRIISGRLSASGRSTLPSISRQFHCVIYRDRLILQLILVACRILWETVCWICVNVNFPLFFSPLFTILERFYYYYYYFFFKCWRSRCWVKERKGKKKIFFWKKLIITVNERLWNGNVN